MILMYRCAFGIWGQVFEIQLKAHIKGELILYLRIQNKFTNIFVSFNRVVINHQKGGDWKCI
jgi:hypothetical protein